MSRISGKRCFRSAGRDVSGQREEMSRVSGKRCLMLAGKYVSGQRERCLGSSGTGVLAEEVSQSEEVSRLSGNMCLDDRSMTNDVDIVLTCQRRVLQ